jgi:AraC family transcriptional regulator, transcriptional activator of pobA
MGGHQSNSATIRRGTTAPPGRAFGWPKNDLYRLLQPQINAEGTHIWPFDSVLPVDLRMLSSDGQNTVQKNRHDYFEIFVLCSGATTFYVQDRLLPMNQGDLAIIGSTLYHSAGCPPNSRMTIGTLYFDPDWIRSDGSANSAQYLMPFLQQDSGFPHVLPAKTGVPKQVFDLMRRIHGELPGSSMRGRLAIKTYLKMILMLLVNQYSSYAGTVEIFRRQQCALDSLHNFFEFLRKHIGEALQVQDAARLCGLTESDFMYFFREVSGRSFRSYLNHCRVERAQVLLAGTNRPISEIAQEMGFCDQSYFGAVFHRIRGVTPAAYRRRHHSGLGLPPEYIGSGGVSDCAGPSDSWKTGTASSAPG